MPSSVQSNLQYIDFMSMLRVYVAFSGVFSRLGSPATFGRVLRTRTKNLIASVLLGAHS